MTSGGSCQHMANPHPAAVMRHTAVPREPCSASQVLSSTQIIPHGYTAAKITVAPVGQRRPRPHVIKSMQKSGKPHYCMQLLWVRPGHAKGAMLFPPASKCPCSRRWIGMHSRQALFGNLAHANMQAKVRRSSLHGDSLQGHRS